MSWRKSGETENEKKAYHHRRRSGGTVCGIYGGRSRLSLYSGFPAALRKITVGAGRINGEQSGGQTALQSHWKDTMKAGSGLSDPNAVRNLVRGASEIICGLMDLGTPFQMTEEGPALRKLGGHTRPRTVYAGNSTGKAILTALADAVRRQEAAGLVTRMDNHRFRKLILQEERCLGCFV